MGFVFLPANHDVLSWLDVLISCIVYVITIADFSPFLGCARSCLGTIKIYPYAAGKMQTQVQDSDTNVTGQFCVGGDGDALDWYAQYEAQYLSLIHI